MRAMMKQILGRNIKLCILFVCSFLFMSMQVQAQIQVTGFITDKNNELLIGATVNEKGTNNGTMTDIDGKYTLNVSNRDAVLVFTFVGFVTSEIKLNGRTKLNVQLNSSEKDLDEIIVVGYGTQKKLSMTSAISQIDGEELLKAPTANITNLLAGRISGVIALQESGQPGSDASSLLVRGSGAKYVVDGIERSFAEIDPNDVESVSVLKDAASAAVYGLDASSVIIVTTKRGNVSPSKINFNASYGISSNALMLKMLDGPGYAYWYNKGLEMDGNTPIFTAEHVQKMMDGVDGWGNTNWYKETFGTGSNSSYNVNATGGSDKIKYFVSLGNFNQKGNVEGFEYNRINLRSNIDATIVDNLELTFDISGRIEKRDRPGYSASPADWNNVPQQAMRALPFVPKYYEGLPVSTRTSSSFVNPLAASSETGYNRVKTNNIQTNIALKYNMPFLKGLSAKFAVAYDYSDQMTKGFSTPYYTYVATVPSSTNPDISYAKSYDARGNNASLTEGLAHSYSLTTNTSLYYTNKWGLHDITALALMETRESNSNNFSATGYGFDIYALDELKYAKMQDKNVISGMSSETRLAGFIGRVNYSYDSKYLVEISSRYDGSYIFGGKNINGKRWVLTPATSLGWRISEEEWMKNSYSNINNLKLRGSIGLTALSTGIPSYFFLDRLIMVENVAVIGNATVNGLNTSNPANLNLTWAKQLQYNLGFDLTMWNGLFGIEFDVFYKYLYDMPAASTSTIPDSFGGYAYGYENTNKQDHKGFEVTFSHSHKIGEFSYKIDVNGSYTKRRWLKYNDSENTPDWLKLTGKEVGSQVGFIALGLFQSQEEIDNSAKITGKDVRVGDIKYLDRNGDGVISYEQDRGYIGKSAYPTFVGGLNFSGEWKGIDISLSWQGALGRDVALTGVYSGGIMDHTSMTRPFYHGGNSPVYLVENSWTEENPTAEFPRLSIVPASSNNAYSSTFWYRNGDYLRLKSLQIGYTIPPKFLKAVRISQLRVYAEGQNLLTFSGLSKYNIDPEQPAVSNGYYPQQIVIAGGLKLTF